MSRVGNSRRKASHRRNRPLTSEVLESRTLLAADIFYRVNAGGYAVTDADLNWAEDVGHRPAPYSNAVAAESATFSSGTIVDLTDPSVPSGTSATLFQSERWDKLTGEEMKWSFPVTPGEYEVRLYFAETWSGTMQVGARQFDVAVEGVQVLDDYDIFADVGANKAVVKAFQTTSDEVLNVDFAHVKDNPAIKAIEILSVEQGNSLAASSDQLTFSSTTVGQSSQQTLTLTNSGAAGSPAITLSGTTISGPGASQFSDSFNDATPAELQPGESITLNVSFSPTSSGAHEASLQISHSGLNAPLTLPLSGSASLATNNPPVLALIGNQTVTEGSSLTLDLSATDAENDPLELIASALPSYATLIDHGDGTGKLILAPVTGDAGTTSITLTARETASGSSDSETFSVTVQPHVSNAVLLVVDKPSSLPAGDQALLTRLQTAGYSVTLADDSAVTVGDASGKSLIVIAESSASTSVGNKFANLAVPLIVNEPYLYDDLGMTGVDSSNYNWKTNQTSIVIAQAGHYLAGGFTGNVSVYSTPDSFGYGVAGSGALKIATVPGDATKSTIFAYDAGATMPGGTAPARRVGFFLDVSGPAHLTTQGGALLDAAVRWAMNRVPQTEADSYSLTQDTTLTVDAASGLLINDLDSDTLTAVLVDNVTSGQLSLEANGAFTYTPGAGFSGTDTFTYRASDGVDAGNVVTVTLTVSATATNAPPVLTDIPDKTVTAGSSITIPLSASDPNGNAIVLSATGLPSYATLVDNGDGTGSIVVSPGASQSGQFTVTVTATDNGSPALSASDSFTLTVTADTTNSAPVLTDIPNTTVTAGSSATIEMSASDPNGDPIVLTATGLPSFATLVDNGDGTGSIQVAPGTEQTGQFTITVTATDNGSPALSASDSFTLTVSPAPSAETIVHRVNAGGSFLPADPSWTADTSSAPSSHSNTSAAVSKTYQNAQVINLSHASIPAGTPAALFQSERWDDSAGEEMQWQFAVTPGSYEVRLYFAEIYSGNFSVGKRQFDVSIEGALVLDNYDIFAKVGSYAGIVESFQVQSDNLLNIDFAHVADHPAIKAIEIVAIGDSANTLGTSSPALQFGAVTVNGSGQQSVTLTNLGQSGDPSIVIDSTTLTGTHAGQFGDSFDDAGSVTLAPGQSTTIQVSFQPTSEGSKTASLAVQHSGSNAPLVISLAGEGTAVATNNPPVLSPIGNVTVAADQSHTVQLSASDPDGQAIALSATGLPSFASFVDNGNGTGQIVLNPTATHAGSYTIQVTATDAGSPTASDSESFVVTVQSSSSVLYRVNAGGAEIAGAPAWTADTSASPSMHSNAATAASQPFVTSTTIDMSHASVPSGTPMALFQSERWDDLAGEEMQWNFATGTGSYEVRLYFAETYFATQSVGARVFDVSIEGEVVLNDYDVFAEVGGYKGVVKSFLVQSDGNLDIDFAHIADNPAIKGIEILQVAAADQLVTSTTSLDYGLVLVGSTNSKTFQLTNAGSAGDSSITIDPASASLSSPNAAVTFQFAQSSLITLAPGQSTIVTVHYMPTTASSVATALVIPHSGENSPITVSIEGSATNDIPINFGKSTLTGASLAEPTSLQFGPDGRLYVAQQNGMIYAYTIERQGANSYQVVATQQIDLINKIANHDDNGALNTSVKDRLVTGLLVTGTAQNPVLYVTSSDPRIGAGFSGSDLNLDTNSGILSRLSWNGAAWQKLDLVRGLPRSEENHASNGLALDTASNTLYIAQGGNTNMGATSFNFALLPEFALSAAILSVDLSQIGNTTYDLPTLNDEDRSGVNDLNDPFGGNDGKNQAVIVPGGPVQVYAPGFRNPYDVLLTQDGRMFTVDNGPNSGWGDVPIGEGPAGNATNDQHEPGTTYGDSLHFVSGAGYYGGHPNPTRSNMNNTFNASNPQSPVSVNNPIESDYLIPGAENGSLFVFPASTNGLTEYTASNFGGKMKGDLLAASFDNTIGRAKVNASNDGLLLGETLFNSVGHLPLDIVALGDNDAFPGTVWVADIGTNKIIIFEPADFGGGGGGPGDPDDLDGDGYSNEDETANGTDPNNGADTPPDWDGDFSSDLFDNDDDNDTLLDHVDPAAVDAQNGQGTAFPVFYSWENDAPRPGGLLGLGFTGLMTNGSDDYLTLFDPAAVTAGGAGGVLTVDAAGPGTALGSANSQDQAFQFGVNVSGVTEPLAAYTRVGSPFAGLTPQAGQEMGLYLGNGDQDNYIEIGLTGNGGGGIFVRSEFGGAVSGTTQTALAMPGPTSVDLYLSYDPVARTVQASYAVMDANKVLGPRTLLGSPIAVPAGLLVETLFAGVISTSPESVSTPLPVTWDFLGVVPDQPGELAPSVSSIAFTSTAVDSSTQQTIELINAGHAGDSSITIDSTTISGADASQFSDSFADAGSITLAPGESTTITVTFAPTGAGSKSATLTINHSGAGGALAIPLSGTALTASSAPKAEFTIHTGSGINSSTFNNGSFIIENQSESGQKITSVTVDLSTAMMPDMVYDPQGTAGDVVAKDFTVNSGGSTTGYASNTLGSPHDGGYQSLTIAFNDFQPGEVFTFSIDVDPSSIRGLPQETENLAGAVSGVELAGATVTVQFDNGSTLTNQTYRVPSTLGTSSATVASDPLPQPTLTIAGLSNPAFTSQANPTVRISGPVGANVALLVLEGILDTQDVPGGGHNVDTFEANTIVAIAEHFATIGASGFVDVPVTLTSSGSNGGYNYLAATITDGAGRTGPLSSKYVLLYDPLLIGGSMTWSASEADTFFLVESDSPQTGGSANTATYVEPQPGPLPWSARLASLPTTAATEAAFAQFEQEESQRGQRDTEVEDSNSFAELVDRVLAQV